MGFTNELRGKGFQFRQHRLSATIFGHPLSTRQVYSALWISGVLIAASGSEKMSAQSQKIRNSLQLRQLVQKVDLHGRKHTKL
jgi:hypothetical protein